MMFNQYVHACFTSQSLVFGGHQLEKARARDMLAAASNQGKTMRDICTIARSYLRGIGCTSNHINQQIKRIRTVSSYI